VSRFDRTRWTTYGTVEGLGAGRIWGVLVARDGLVWCTHGEQGGFSVFDGTAWTTLTAADGMLVDEVRSIHKTADGAIWFGIHVEDEMG
jgi:ligand-binding sensor domain-containing protein